MSAIEGMPPVKLFTFYCAFCGKRKDTNVRIQKYCNKKCSRLGAEKVIRSYAPHIKQGVKGAMGELTASLGFLGAGFEVYRNVSQQGSCDLIALRGGKIYRVEVKSVGMRKGKIILPSSCNPKNYDVMVYITHQGVVYEPPIENL